MFLTKHFWIVIVTNKETVAAMVSIHKANNGGHEGCLPLKESLNPVGISHQKSQHL